MQCQHCGRDTVDQVAFCNYCGERVAVACGSCERLNPPDSLYCHGCGRSLTESQAEPLATPSLSNEQSPPRPVGLGCPRCGAANEPASAYCFQCGLPLEEDDAPGAGVAASSPILYRSPRTRAIWTSVLLFVTGITVAILMGMTLEVLDLQHQQETVGFVHVSKMAGAQENRDNAELFSSLVSVATAVAFLMWINRASKNLRPLGALGQRFSPGWAVGWWFVPIMFFIRPYQVTAEIWNGSDPDALEREFLNWKAGPVSSLLPWWWALWVASSLIEIIVGFAVEANERSIGILQLQLLGNALTICAALLAIAVVWRTTKRQDEKHRRLMTAQS